MNAATASFQVSSAHDDQVVQHRQRRQRLLGADDHAPDRHDAADRADRVHLLVADARVLARLGLDGVLPGRRHGRLHRRRLRLDRLPVRCRRLHLPGARLRLVEHRTAPTRSTARAGDPDRLGQRTGQRRQHRQRHQLHRPVRRGRADQLGHLQLDRPARPAGTPSPPSRSRSPAATAAPASSGSSTPPTAATRPSTAATTVTNGTAVAGANASLNVSSDGTTTVKWIAEDNVGNISSVSIAGRQARHHPADRADRLHLLRRRRTPTGPAAARPSTSRRRHRRLHRRR